MFLTVYLKYGSIVMKISPGQVAAKIAELRAQGQEVISYKVGA